MVGQVVCFDGRLLAQERTQQHVDAGPAALELEATAALVLAEVRDVTEEAFPPEDGDGEEGRADRADQRPDDPLAQVLLRREGEEERNEEERERLQRDGGRQEGRAVPVTSPGVGAPREEEEQRDEDVVAGEDHLLPEQHDGRENGEGEDPHVPLVEIPGGVRAGEGERGDDQGEPRTPEGRLPGIRGEEEERCGGERRILALDLCRRSIADALDAQADAAVDVRVLRTLDGGQVPQTQHRDCRDPEHCEEDILAHSEGECSRRREKVGSVVDV